MSTVADIYEWTLGDHIRKARRIARLTQAQLGALYGVSDKAIDNWEQDRNYPGDLDRLIDILTDHGVRPGFFDRCRVEIKPRHGRRVAVLPRLDSNQKPAAFRHPRRSVARGWRRIKAEVAPFGLVA